MAKLKTERIIIYSTDERGYDDRSNGPALDFKIDINVAQGGEFTTTFPEDIATKLQDAGVNLRTNGRRDGRKGFFEAKTLDDLLSSVHTTAKEFVSRTLINEEIVIRYGIQTACRYATDGKDFIPHRGFGGASDEFKEREGTKKIHAMNRASFGFNIYTDIVTKRVYRYASGKEKTFYVPVQESTIDDDKPNLKFLSAIYCQEKLGDIMEIGYTEEVAEFFVSIYKVIYKINERVKDFVSPEAIMKLIENKTKLLS